MKRARAWHSINRVVPVLDPVSCRNRSLSTAGVRAVPPAARPRKSKPRVSFPAHTHTHKRTQPLRSEPDLRSRMCVTVFSLILVLAARFSPKACSTSRFMRTTNFRKYFTLHYEACSLETQFLPEIDNKKNNQNNLRFPKAPANHKMY